VCLARSFLLNGVDTVPCDLLAADDRKQVQQELEVIRLRRNH
jgi:hypothetical protein